MKQERNLFEPLTLPCGIVLKNRIIKSAMSDSLGDGTGHPTIEQMKLYQRWAKGGLAVSIIGEVQCSSGFAEKPGNLVLNENTDIKRFCELAEKGKENKAHIWLQLGHAGALAYGPTSSPKGPSSLDFPGLRCAALSKNDIHELPPQFARTAFLAMKAGFNGVQIHAAHGFLLSQFLSPLFNKRNDEYGGKINNRIRLLLEIIEAVRAAVGHSFPVALKLNSSDQLEGGFGEEDAIKVVGELENSSVDLIDISGGTYFPGAKAASDKTGTGPYFLEFAKRARMVTTKPLMLTGGFKTLQQAEKAIADGAVDCVGLARALILQPSLPHLWKKGQMPEPTFPRFSQNLEGGVTAWYTMQMLEISKNNETLLPNNLKHAIQVYEERDKMRTNIWLQYFPTINDL